MRRLILSVVLVAVALAAQLTIVNRLSLPGGAGPDLVLLVVVALALIGGPLPGVLTGFLAGLALDIAPPASHTVGEYALVFCIVGYACGRLSGLGDESPTLYVAISAGAAAGPAVQLDHPEQHERAEQHVVDDSRRQHVLDRGPGDLGIAEHHPEHGVQHRAHGRRAGRDGHVEEG